MLIFARATGRWCFSGRHSSLILFLVTDILSVYMSLWHCCQLWILLVCNWRAELLGLACWLAIIICKIIKYKPLEIFLFFWKSFFICRLLKALLASLPRMWWHVGCLSAVNCYTYFHFLFSYMCMKLTSVSIKLKQKLYWLWFLLS
jgi:hypothetical protein